MMNIDGVDHDDDDDSLIYEGRECSILSGAVVLPFSPITDYKYYWARRTSISWSTYHRFCLIHGDYIYIPNFHKNLNFENLGKTTYQKSPLQSERRSLSSNPLTCPRLA